MNDNRYCVIMAGGGGNRFWPMCREASPKQFMDYTGKAKSLIKTTYDRFSKIVPVDNILVVTVDRYRETVMRWIPNLREENLLLEPYMRGTAPCIAYATYTILKRNPEATIVVTPADHIISNEGLFRQTISSAMEHASTHKALMTIGVVPDHPDTDFGYIQIAGGKKNVSIPMKVKTFTEKPDSELATIFCRSGEFYWNSGIYAWRADVIKDEMEKLMPEVTSLFNGWKENIDGPHGREFLERAYSSCSNLSIDYGVMEKTECAWLYPARFGWSDIGNWDSLYRKIKKRDENGNSSNVANYISKEAHNNLIISDNRKKLVVINGLEDYVIVDTQDALMIAPRDDEKIQSLISDIAMPKFEKYR